MSTLDEVSAVRASAGVVVRADRGVIEVRGSDRVRWLNGMVSNDVAALEAGSEQSGCYALLLTPKGAITADLHILVRPDAFWLETSRDAVAGVIERLERYIVADDVALLDRSEEWAPLGIEGPRAPAAIESVCGAPVELSSDSCADATLAGAEVVIAAYGLSGEAAYQLFVPTSAVESVRSALLAVPDVAQLGSAALDILRIEAGTPQLGAELDEDVLPDEARLDHAISVSKGCYTGQEIVARLRSRGHVNHLLVGLRFENSLPEMDAEIHNETRRTGEVTSCCISPSAGPIGLGFVRRDDAEPGSELRVGDQLRASLFLALGLAHPADRMKRPPARGTLIVFAKAPRPGEVKTRLCPPLSFQQAADFYACMLEDVLMETARTCSALQLDGIVSLHPYEARSEIAHFLPKNLRIVAQRGADLSQRMASAAAQAAAGGTLPVLLRGSDSPLMPDSVVGDALCALEAVDLAVSPDRDGGYSLVGLRRPCAAVFDHPMSTASVLQQTLANARAAGLSSMEIQAGSDIDTADDLNLLYAQRDNEGARQRAPKSLEFAHCHDLYGLAGIGRSDAKM